MLDIFILLWSALIGFFRSRARIKWREHWMGLGSVSTFSLKEACDKARAARQQLHGGIDPLDRSTSHIFRRGLRPRDNRGSECHRQEKRHLADYDPLFRVNRADAALAVATNRAALAQLRSTNRTRVPLVGGQIRYHFIKA